MAALKDIATRLGLKQVGKGYVGACPACGYRQGFSLDEVNGKLLYYCHAGGCNAQEIREALCSIDSSIFLGRSSEAALYAKPAKVANEGQEQYVQYLWSTSRNASGSLAETYLIQRGYTRPIPPAIRYLPFCRHKPSGFAFPAMLSAVTRWPDTQPVAIHRTYLSSDGLDKAPVTPNKMSLGPIEGGSIQLFSPVQGILAICEGVETALSIHQSTDLPVWSALSASGYRQLVLPPKEIVDTVWIFSDNDSVGLMAAYQAAEKWTREGRRVIVTYPPEPGMDFNDLHRGK